MLSMHTENLLEGPKTSCMPEAGGCKGMQAGRAAEVPRAVRAVRRVRRCAARG